LVFLSFCRNVDKITGYRTTTVLCTPVRANRGGGRIVGIIELVNKKNNQLFDESDEDVLAQMVRQFTDDLSAEFSQLCEINSSIASFATPILPSDGVMGRRKDSAKRYEGPTATTANHNNLVESTKKFLEQRTDSGDSAGLFRVGGDSKQRYELDRFRRERRKSFGEKLSMEIEANPELLHNRKN
jgi:hypothetical protein